MKIIFTVTNDLTFDNRMHRICGSLANNGYDVLLVGRKLQSSKPLLTKQFLQYRIRCFFNKGKLFYAEYNIRLFFFLLFKSADAICSIDLDTLLPGYLVSQIKGQKLVYDAHEYFTEVPEVINRPRVQQFWLMLERWILPKLKNAYTVNKSIAAMFQEKYGTPFQVIYNAPSYKETTLPDNFNQRILLYQGALNASRGLEQLLEAMREIDAVLWIIGEGDLSATLREMAQTLQVGDKVIFKGMIAPEQLGEYTRQATVGINVSENAGLSYYYSLNNKFFDYMHAGLPSVTNDFPEYSAINAQYPITLLTRCEVKLLINDINKLINDRELYLKLQQNCVIASKFYCWQHEEKKLLEFYAGLR